MSTDPTTPWERLLDVVADAAAEYREAGRTVVAVEPTDVSVTPPGEGPFGLVLVVADAAHAELVELAAAHEFRTADVFRRVTDDVVLLAVALESADGEASVVLPAYYERTAAEEGQLRAHDGSLFTHVRGLGGTDVVTFEHVEPSAFFPDERFDEG